MILNLGSLAFNADIATPGGNPAWGTELGQGEGYKFVFEDMSDFFTGMVYKSIVDTDNVTCPLGKGGNQRADYDFVIASLFEKVYVNGKKVNDARFLLLVVKKLNGDHHVGRRTIKYNPRMTYRGEYINEDCYQKMALTMGLPNDAAWFVYEIYIVNQDELHFTAFELGDEPQTYRNNDERKNAFISRLPKNGERQYRLYQPNLPLQQIFYGAPGTGKSNTIKCEVDQKDLPRVRTTFHPDSDYSTFVGAYKPTSVEVPMMTMIGTKAVPVENPDGTQRKEKKIVYEFVPQAFLKAYTGAWKNQDKPFFLIIEEINRGNCAQIFGDLFQLLDRNDETGLSDYPISPDEDIQKFLLADKKYGFAALTEEQKAAIPEEVLSGELMILPKNLHIWATMNTSDQSLFPIDSAFKRRWDWQYMPISDGKKGWQIAANGKRYDWWQFLQKMNDKIGTATNSEDKKLGYFFCKAKNGVIDAETFVGKVVFYIWNDVFKDFAEEAGDLFKDDDVDSPLLSFNKFYTVGIDGKTKVVEQKVELLLQNLGVEEVDDVEYVEDEDVDENLSDEARSSNNRLHVTFPDGETIRVQTGKEYVDVIKKIGLDKAYDVAQSKDPSILKCAFVTKEKEDAIENSTYLRYETIGEYHVVRGMSGDTMRPFLEKISNQYNLGLKFYRQ